MRYHTAHVICELSSKVRKNKHDYFIYLSISRIIILMLKVITC